MTTGNPRPGMAGMYQSRLTSPHMLQDQNFNPMNPKPRMGGVACIAAACKYNQIDILLLSSIKGLISTRIWCSWSFFQKECFSSYTVANVSVGNGKELSTGSTLIKWGTQLGALRVGWDDMTLHEWYRDQRQVSMHQQMPAYSADVASAISPGSRRISSGQSMLWSTYTLTRMTSN